jgi:putative membrane protein
MNLTKKITLLVAIAATFATSAFAEISRADKNFFEQAARAGQKEVDISQQALVHLTAPDVRNFAQMIVADHTKANQELSALAARKGVALPANDFKAAQKWARNDKDVDDEYLATMKDDHQDAIDLFEKAAKSDDPDVAAFAQNKLPTLRHHLETVKQLQKVN